jgi:putative spermidine/putrescine transport system permease protein
VKRPVWALVIGVFVYVFMLLPVVLVVWMSFFSKGLLIFPPSGYSLSWYAGLPSHSQLFSGLWYSLEIAAIAAVIAVVLGILAALGVSRSRIRGKAWLEQGFTLPLVIPAIISGMAIYIYLYQLSSVAGTSLVPSTWALIAAHVMITLPWTFRLAYTGLVAIGRDVEKASMDLGYSGVQTMWRITLPLLRSAIIGGVIFAFVFSFSDLEISLFLIAPGLTTLPVMIGNRFVRFGEVFAGGTKQ